VTKFQGGLPAAGILTDAKPSRSGRQLKEEEVNLYDLVSPMDFRYYASDREVFQRLHGFLSEAANIRYAAEVEAAAVRVMAKHGLTSPKVAEEVTRAARGITAEEVYEEEARSRHQIRALVNCMRRRVSPEACPYIHLFATSADILDTANALRLQDVTFHVLLPDAWALESKLIQLARQTSEVVQIGRTHGKHAEPITFGYALALYVSRLGQRIEVLDRAARNLRGMYSGAVGAFNALSLAVPDDPQGFERDVLGELGLQPSDTGVSTQVVEPEYVTDFAYAVVSAFGVLANLADDIRHLHRTEIAEVQERYARDDIGSSTMPHKVNPKNFEHVKSLWKAFAPRMLTVQMDQISEHQRDLTNSASGRFITELVAAFDYALVRMTRALGSIHVDREQMRRNLEMSEDKIVAEPLYILLALQGHANAYDTVRRLMAKSEETKQPLRALIEEDDELTEYLARLDESQKAILSDPKQYVGDAVGRTLMTCEEWERRIERIVEVARLHRPRITDLGSVCVTAK
jgi:adenylosuccinate lyase